MYSEEDINSAVASGALSAEAAESFRSHMSRVRELPRQSEENFRLINSFNDIFVTIGIVILLVAVGTIGQAIGEILAPFPSYVSKFDAPTDDWVAFQKARQLHDFLGVALAGVFVAAAAWPLAEFFTRKRRMALPSIVLLLAFVGAVLAATFGFGMSLVSDGNERLGAVLLSVSALLSAGAAFLHWRRFQVPITVAAGTAGLVATIIALIAAAINPADIDEKLILGLVFVGGLAVFTLAMRWDISDRTRTTRRSDVAFWLHLLAAPLIAHPIFAAMGVTEGYSIGIGSALAVLGIYIAFGVIALAIDRRALLVSALAYVLFALTFLFREFGAVELNFALTALVIGSALLSLSAFWQVIRKTVVSALPADIQEKLPATSDIAPAQVVAAS